MIKFIIQLRHEIHPSRCYDNGLIIRVGANIKVNDKVLI